jgi:hypothetical protein
MLMLATTRNLKKKNNLEEGMSENLEEKLPEAERYKKEAKTFKKNIQQAIEQVQPYAEHMRARHIEGLHAFYKEKLGYTGAADIASMKAFKHNYFEKKENTQEAAEFFTDFHAHKAILTFYEEIFKQKNEKPLHKLSGQEYQTRAKNAMDKAKEMRTTNNVRYKLLVKDYAGVEPEVVQQLITSHKHQFIDVYTQRLLPQILNDYAQQRANIDINEVLKGIKRQHLHHDKELEELVQKLMQREQEQPYMASPYDEAIDPSNYQLPPRELPPQPGPQQQAPATQNAPAPQAQGQDLGPAQ